mgnify:CR=1 FL=1
MRSDTIRGAHARTAEEIAQSDADATAFFTRHRPELAMRALRREKYVAHLWEAVREGLAYKYDKKRVARAAERKAVKAAEMAREEARLITEAARIASIRIHVDRPEEMPETALHTLTGDERYAARRGARLFFRGPWKAARIARLEQERTDPWGKVRKACFDVWKTAPRDPISWEEYAAIATKSPEVRRVLKAAQTYRRRQITPVGGVTPERAAELALAALIARENGDAPTFR